MTDKAHHHAGWVVQMMLPPTAPGAVPAFKYYNAAIVDAAKAVAAVEAEAKRQGIQKDVRTDVIRKLSAAEVDLIHLKAGEVKPA